MKMILHALSALSAAVLLPAAEPLDLPTGREITLPVEVHGAYRLEAENGRILATGNADGQPCFYLAPLKPGTSLPVKLIADQRCVPLLLHSPQPLAGVRARFNLKPELRRKLVEAGVIPDEKSDLLLTDTLTGGEDARLRLLFPGRSDLPLALPEQWSEIRLIRAEIPGSLGVSSLGKREIIDRGGRASCIELREKGRRLIIFPPEFDCSKLEYILLIQTLLKKESKP